MVGLMVLLIRLNLTVGLGEKLGGKVRANRLKVLIRPAVLHTDVEVCRVVEELRFAEVRILLLQLVKAVDKGRRRLLTQIHGAASVAAAGIPALAAVSDNGEYDNRNEDDCGPNKVAPSGAAAA